MTARLQHKTSNTRIPAYPYSVLCCPSHSRFLDNDKCRVICVDSVCREPEPLSTEPHRCIPCSNWHRRSESHRRLSVARMVCSKARTFVYSKTPATTSKPVVGMRVTLARNFRYTRLGPWNHTCWIAVVSVQKKQILPSSDDHCWIPGLSSVSTR